MRAWMRAGGGLLAGAVFLALVPALAQAHIVKGVGDFYAGMLHPLTTLEHVLPFVALALLAGQSGRKRAIGTLVAFPVALLCGALAAPALELPPLVSWVNLASMVALGALVALDRRVPTLLLLVLVTAVGLSHGLANGAEMTTGMKAHRFIPGVALVGLLVTAYGIGLVRRLRAPWALVGVRVTGSWITAIGLMALAL